MRGGRERIDDIEHLDPVIPEANEVHHKTSLLCESITSPPPPSPPFPLFPSSLLFPLSLLLSPPSPPPPYLSLLVGVGLGACNWKNYNQNLQVREAYPTAFSE